MHSRLTCIPPSNVYSMPTTLTPYLYCDGTCRPAFERYQEIFGGSLDLVTGEQFGSDPNRIMHARLITADGWTLFGSDGEGVTGEVRRAHMNINAPADELPTARRWFTALLGDAVHTLAPMPWGGTYGQVVDEFGVTWSFDVGD